MTETLEQIEGQVRGKVDNTVAHAREALDIRQHVNKRPWLSLGGAALLGYLVGAMGGDDDMPPPPHAPGQPMRYYAQPASYSSQSSYSPQPSQSSSEERHSSNGHSYSGGQSSSGHSSQFMGAMAQVADPIKEELSVMAMAAVRSAMRVLRETLQDSIPQFDAEYKNVQRERGDETDSSAQGFSSRSTGMGQSGMTSQSDAGAYGTRPGTTTPSGITTQSETGTYGSRPGTTSSL